MSSELGMSTYWQNHQFTVHIYLFTLVILLKCASRKTVSFDEIVFQQKKVLTCRMKKSYFFPAGPEHCLSRLHTGTTCALRLSSGSEDVFGEGSEGKFAKQQIVKKSSKMVHTGGLFVSAGKPRYGSGHSFFS